MYRRLQHNDRSFYSPNQETPKLDQDGMIPPGNLRMPYNLPSPDEEITVRPPEAYHGVIPTLTRAVRDSDSLPFPDEDQLRYLGWFFRARARKLARRKGTFTAAKHLRVSGYPLHVALMVLA